MHKNAHNLEDETQTPYRSPLLALKLRSHLALQPGLLVIFHLLNRRGTQLVSLRSAEHFHTSRIVPTLFSVPGMFFSSTSESTTPIFYTQLNSHLLCQEFDSLLG